MLPWDTHTRGTVMFASKKMQGFQYVCINARVKTFPWATQTTCSRFKTGELKQEKAAQESATQNASTSVGKGKQFCI